MSARAAGRVESGHHIGGMRSVITDQATQNSVDDDSGLVRIAQNEIIVASANRTVLRDVATATRTAHVASRTAVGAREGSDSGSLTPSAGGRRARGRARRVRRRRRA